jgi:hypothetical protein
VLSWLGHDSVDRVTLHCDPASTATPVHAFVPSRADHGYYWDTGPAGLSTYSVALFHPVPDHGYYWITARTLNTVDFPLILIMHS